MNEEEAASIKEQLLKQLEGSDVEGKENIIESIKAMSIEELEAFLEKNNVKLKQGQESSGEECVFCKILENKIPSYKLEENKKSLAILEINPLSLGHSIIISKKHDKLPSSAFTLANKIAKRIKSKFKAEDVKIENFKLFGHQLINIIPLFKGQKPEKKKASPEELQKLQAKLVARQRAKREKPKTKVTVQLEKAPRRIP